jgi:hypothetical protein
MAEQQSHAGKRPFLDYMAEHYVKAFAESTHRSLSNAASVLIEAGYRSAVEQLETKARHYKAPTESDDRKAVAYYLDANLIKEIKRLALSEKKSASGMAADLIRAGLQARAAASS